VQAVEVPAISSPPGLLPPPGLSLADPEVKAPIVIDLEDCLRDDNPIAIEPHGETKAMSAPPGLAVLLQLDDCLLESKVPTKEKLFLDLESSILDEKVPPPSLGVQLVEMTAQLTALKTQIDDIVFQTEKAEKTQLVLEDLTAKSAEVKQPSDQIDPADTIAVPTPLRTALRSKAAPFQPFMSSTWSPQANWQNNDSIGYGYGGVMAF